MTNSETEEKHRYQLYFCNAMPDKKPHIMLPTASEDAPVRNFLILLLLIPAAPFLLLYSIITGRLQNPFIVGACLTLLLCFGGYYTYSKYFVPKPTRKDQILSLVQEVKISDKKELRKKFSTLRKSIGAENLPKQLAPLLDVEQDMLTINYYYFLIEANYIGKNAEGAVYVLQNTLYSSNEQLARAAWDSLSLINTPEANRAKEIFANDVEEINKKAAEQQKKTEFKQKYIERKRNWSDDLKDSFRNFKNEW